MKVGDLVCYDQMIGIVVCKKEYPTGVVRNLIEWTSGNSIFPGLWINSTDLELCNEH